MDDACRETLDGRSEGTYQRRFILITRPRIIDHDIQAPELIFRGRYQFTPLLLTSDVRSDSGYVGGIAGGRGILGLQSGGIHVGRDDRGAFGEEFLGYGEAEAGGSACSELVIGGWGGRGAERG